MTTTYDTHDNVLTYRNSGGYSYEYTRDADGNVLTYRASDGFSSEYTRDASGNELTYSSSNGFSDQHTRDADGNVLTYSDSEGFSYEYTRDASGNVLTYRNSRGFNGVVIANDTEYTLYQDVNTKLFTAGCREDLTLEQALVHWDRTDARAILFTKALKEIQTNEM
jgi:YD repeat-containing protein